MVIQFSILNIIFLFSSVIGMLVSVILIVYKRKIQLSNLLLGLHFLFFAMAIFLSFLLYSDIGQMFPFSLRLGNFFLLIAIPFSYLYFRWEIRKKRPKLLDLLHLLPALIYFIDYLPFFLLSADEKISILEVVGINKEELLAYNEGYLAPKWFHLVLRYLVFLFYWTLQFKLLLTPKVNLKRNEHWFHWICSFQAIQISFFLPWLIFFLWNKNSQLLFLSEGFAASGFTLIGLSLFLKPKILYGLTTYQASINTGANLDTEKACPHHLEAEEIDKIITEMEVKMTANSLFLKKGYSLQDLSSEVNVPSWTLSNILNRNLNFNFNEYLNKHRIEYCLRKIKEGEHKTKTIEGLALDCGFNNRNSFTLAFKKFQQKTPSEYIRSLTFKTSANNYK